MKAAARASSLFGSAWIRQSGAFALCGCAAFVMLLLPFGMHRSTPQAIWPANAVVLAFLIRNPARTWPGYLTAGFAGQLLASLLFTAKYGVNLGMGLCNMAEILSFAVGLRLFVRTPLDFGNPRHLAIFAGLAFAASAIAAAGAVGVLMLANPPVSWPDLPIWTLSDALGILIMTPVILVLDRSGLGRLLNPRGLPVRAGLFALLIAATVYTFINPQLQLRFLVIPLLVLIAFREETPGVALGVLILGMIALRYSDYAPDGHLKAAIEDRGLFVQVLLFISAATAFPVAAAVAHRRELAASLAARAHEFEMLAEYSSDVILRLALDGTIRYVSPSCRQFGYEPESVTGTSVFDLLSPEATTAVRETFASRAAGRTDIPNFRRRRIRTKTGGWTWVEVCSQALPPAGDGRISEVICQVRDVSVRMALEDELRRKRDEAEAATAAKSEFLASMSHEIRTPLTGIIGFSRLLDEMDGLPGAAATYARRISTASQALLTVVNDILDLSKIEAGQVELDPRGFALAAFVAETLELVEAQAQAKGLSLQLELAADLPQAVKADSARLRQVVLNLLTNAIKFTEQGEVRVSVRHGGEGDDALRISVSDTGVGIAPDRLERLFQRFAQADESISRRYGGTGLGLAISKSLVELMGGTIGVDSVEGEGTTVWFVVEAPAVAEASARPAAQGQEQAPAEGAVQRGRILVVDDVAMNRELVRTMLSIFGHALVEAASGAQAVQAAAGEPFDLILMDMQMPDIDGPAATRAIRGAPGPNRQTPIIALTANVMGEQIAACRAAGMDDHISKPISPADLLAKTAYWLEHGAQAREAGEERDEQTS